MTSKLAHTNWASHVKMWILFTLFVAGMCCGTDAKASNLNAATDPSAAVEAVSGPSTAGIPRDSISSVSLTFTCTDSKGNAVSGASVSFSATSPGTVSPSSATTDSNGNAVVTVKSQDISASDANTTVTASCNKQTASTSVSLHGLAITISSDISKIYPKNATSYHNFATVTASVKDSTGSNAQGVVTFVTQGGAWSNSNPVTLSNGTCFNQLSTGNKSAGKFIDNVTATIGPVTSNVLAIEYLFPLGFNFKTVQPQCKIPGGSTNTPASSSATFTLVDYDNNLYPGASVNDSWIVPVGQSVTHSFTTPVPNGEAITDQSPPVTTAGSGSVQAVDAGAGVSSVQHPLSFVASQNWNITFNTTIKNGMVQDLQGKLGPPGSKWNYTVDQNFGNMSTTAGVAYTPNP